MLDGVYTTDKEDGVLNRWPTGCTTPSPEKELNTLVLPRWITDLLSWLPHTIVAYDQGIETYRWTAGKGLILHPAWLGQNRLDPTVRNKTPLSKPMSRREQCLEGARKLVMGSREADYGSPKQNFDEIAALWTVILRLEDDPISAGQVVLCMDAVKTARLMNKGNHEDSWMDKAGYAAVGNEVC